MSIFTLTRPTPPSLEFDGKDLKNILRNKKDNIGIDNRSFSNNVYYINLDNNKLLLMYKTDENEYILNNYQEIIYDPEFDSLNELKFWDGTNNYNLFDAYAGNGDYSHLFEACLTIPHLVGDNIEQVKLISNTYDINFNDLRKYDIFSFTGSTDYTVTIPLAPPDEFKGDKSRLFKFRLNKNYTGHQIWIRKSDNSFFLPPDEPEFDLTTLTLSDSNGHREYNLRALNINIEGVASSEWLLESSVPRPDIPNHVPIVDGAGLNYNLLPFQMNDLKDVDADLNKKEYHGWVFTLGTNGHVILAPPSAGGIGNERRETIKSKSVLKSGNYLGTRNYTMLNWEDNQNDTLLFDYFLLTSSGVIFLRKGKSTTVSGRVRVQGQGISSTNYYTASAYAIINNARQGQQSEPIIGQKGGYHDVNYSLYVGEVNEGEKVNIEVEIITHGTATVRVYTVGGNEHFMDVATTFLDFNLLDNDPRWVEDNNTTNPIITLSTSQMVKTNATYDDIVNPKVHDSTEYYDEVNHNLAIIDENNVIKRTKKISDIYNTFTPESSFLVSLGDNVNLLTNKITFDNLIQNNSNLYQNGELVVNYSGMYSLHGTINAYCTKINIVPVDLTLSVIYNNEVLIDTTVTVRHANMIHNIPVNLFLRLISGDVIYLELTPSIASDGLFIKKNSYWNCGLVTLAI